MTQNMLRMLIVEVYIGLGVLIWAVLTLRTVFQKGFTQMADGLTDLKQVVIDLNTSFTAEIAAIATALQNANIGGVTQADAEAIVGQLQQLRATVDAKTQELLTPPAAPGPVPVA